MVRSLVQGDTTTAQPTSSVRKAHDRSRAYKGDRVMIKQIGSMDVSSRDAIPLDWELRSCQNQACPHDTWVVKRAPVFSNVWWVAPRPNQSLVLVAGRDP